MRQFVGIKCQPYLALLAIIEEKLPQKRPLVVGIDGNSGAGKSSLAALLAEQYGCAVVAMDDFFLPPELRTAERLARPGGNIHSERFLDEAAAGIAGGGPFAYRVFDCKRMAYRGEKQIPAGCALIVCEGVYSLHPLYRDIYDVAVFLRCPPEEQSARILARSGPALHERFLKEWIPMEERYFAAFQIARGCDCVIET